MAQKSNPQASSSAPAYTIISTADQIAVGEDGRLGDVKVITFKTYIGDVGMVKIPKGEFTAKKAAEMILAEVDELLKLRGM